MLCMISPMSSAREILRDVMEKITPVSLDAVPGVKRKLLMFFAQKSLEKTAKFMNFLENIHILT